MTRYAALGIRAIPSLHKLLFLVDPKLHLYEENLEMLIFSITHAIEPLYSNSAVIAGWLQSTRAQNTAPGLCNKGDYFL